MIGKKTVKIAKTPRDQIGPLAPPKGHRRRQTEFALANRDLLGVSIHPGMLDDNLRQLIGMKLKNPPQSAREEKV